MKKALKFIILTYCCAIAGTVYAIEKPWYEIEILVFEQSDVNRLNSENWDQKIPLVATKESLDFISPDPSLVKLEQICLNGSLLEVKEMLPFSLVEETQEVTANIQEVIQESGTGLSATDQPKEIEAEVVEELPFQILNKELNQLNELETTLRRGRGFRSLMHITWRQPVDSKNNSKLIRLYTGKNYSDTFNPEGDARVDIATYIPDTTENAFQGSFVETTKSVDSDLFNQINNDSLDFIEPVQTVQKMRKQQLVNCQQLYQEIADIQHQDVWQVDGNIRLYVERYLHLETDLMLRLPGKIDIQLGAIETSLAADKLLNSLNNDLDSDLNSELNKKSQSMEDGFGWQLGNNFLMNNQDTSVIQQDVLNKYSMQQSRRMKSNEVHYIDHPLFGILIEIRPYDKDAVNDIEDNQANNAN